MAADTTTRPTVTGFASATGFVAAALLLRSRGKHQKVAIPSTYRYNKRWFLSFSVTFHEQNPHTQ